MQINFPRTGLVKLTLAASVIMAATAGMAHAKSDGKRGHRGMDWRAADTDGDRAVSKDEFKVAYTKRFSNVDTDGNGSVTKAELETALQDVNERRAKRLSRRVRMLDTDWNGEVSAAEMETAMTILFERLDRNEDGKLSREDRRGRKGRKGGRWWR